MHAFGPAIVSAVVLLLYAAHMLGYGPHIDDADHELLKNLTIMVAGYWVGSSSSSVRKTELREEK